MIVLIIKKKGKVKSGNDMKMTKRRVVICGIIVCILNFFGLAWYSNNIVYAVVKTIIFVIIGFCILYLIGWVISKFPDE